MNKQSLYGAASPCLRIAVVFQIIRSCVFEMRRPFHIAALAFLITVIYAPAIAQTNSNTQPQNAPPQNTQQNAQSPPAQNPATAQPSDQTKAESATAQDASNAQQIERCKKDIYDIVEVMDAYNVEYRNRQPPAERRKAGLNEIIFVEVSNLECLIRKSKCQPPFSRADGCEPQNIALFIDGRAIKKLEPESGAPTLDNPGTPGAVGTLRYHLQRDADAAEGINDTDDEHWADLLGLGSDLLNWSDRRVEISVGLADEFPVRTSVKGENSFRLVRIRGYRLPFWIILTAAILYLLYRLGKKRELLRDNSPVLWKQEKPYSLSAVQAAWWFIIILISFIFIWLVTDQYDFSSTALILLSIGLGTALVATMIDSNKTSETKGPEVNSSELNSLLSQKQKLETEMTNLEVRVLRKENGAVQAEFEKKKKAYADLISEIESKFPKVIGPAHQSFLTDILSDSSGINFHRFQMLVWTIVLGVLFIHSVVSTLAMPDFSTTLLSLMGISAGTYLGFKIPENNNVTTQPTAPPGNAGNAAQPGAGDENNPTETEANNAGTNASEDKG